MIRCKNLSPAVGPLSQMSQMSQLEITLPVIAPLECRNVCPNVTSVTTVPIVFNLSSKFFYFIALCKVSASHHPCASTNPSFSPARKGRPNRREMSLKSRRLEIRLPVSGLERCCMTSLPRGSHTDVLAVILSAAKNLSVRRARPFPFAEFTLE